VSTEEPEDLDPEEFGDGGEDVEDEDED
jgi:hypothetical protein